MNEPGQVAERRAVLISTRPLRSLFRRPLGISTCEKAKPLWEARVCA
jgi:hypothetical protein